MLIELRTYKTRPGQREAFIKVFEEKARPAQEEAGIQILGQFRSLEDENVFIWLRGFPNEEERQARLDAFYGSDYWRNSLRDEIVSLLEEYTGHLLQPTASSPWR